MRTLFRQGNLPHLDTERVVVFMPNFRPQREPPRMRDRLANIGNFLIQQGLLPDRTIVKEAIQRIITPVDERAIAFQGDDELGALAQVHEMLFGADVNVYAASGVASGTGKFGYVIYVRENDFETAAAALGI